MVETPSIDESRVRDALQRVVQSETFDGANRLIAFLTYVVEETLAGREDMIRAKRIAADVYGRPLDEDAGQDTLVRVDAGRLRRRLSLYYAEEGRNDPIRIAMNPGGYVATFEFHAKEQDEPQSGVGSRSDRPKAGWPVIPLAGLALLAIAAVAIVWPWSSNPKRVEAVSEAGHAPSAPPDEQTTAENQAMFEKSPFALLANTHIETARDLIYPPLSPKRVTASRDLCEEAKDLDPQNPGGYSCASRAKGFQAFLLARGSERNSLVAAALADAQTAVELDPTISYSQSALAWARFVNGEFEDAMEIGRRAVLLDPEDELSRNYLGMIASFGGEFEEVLAGPPGSENGSVAFAPITVTRALFHTGAYDEAIAMVEKTAAKSGQTSNFMLAVLAASHQALGDYEAAHRYAKELAERRPQYAEQFRIMYRRPEDADQLIDLINAALKSAESG